MDPLELHGELGIQRTGADEIHEGNLLISMDGYKEYYQHFIKDPSDFENSIRLAMRQPGIQTIWNHRRIGVLNGQLDLKREISWIRLILTAHPKCSNLWNQLFWMIKQNTCEDMDFKEIFMLGSKILGNYSLKYTLWQIEKRGERGDSNRVIWIQNEIIELKAWCRLHPNDYSGFSLLFTLLRLDNEVDWEEHGEWLDSLMELYPERPALKTHKRVISLFQINSPIIKAIRTGKA